MTTEAAEALRPFTDLLERAPEATRAVLNLLTEAPYFYREDAPERFAFLRANRLAFEAFFEATFGWQLEGDQRLYRLIRPQAYNPALRATQRAQFTFTRRNDCLAFLAVLLFAESKMQAEQWTPDDPEPLRFTFGELFDDARTRFAQADLTLGDEALRKALRAIFPELDRARLLAYLEPEPGDKPTEEQKIYTILPALFHYSTATARTLLDQLRAGEDPVEAPDETR